MTCLMEIVSRWSIPNDNMVGYVSFITNYGTHKSEKEDSIENLKFLPVI